MEETQIEKPKEPPELFVLAKNPQEMVKAKDRMLAFFDAKLAQEKKSKADLEDNLAVAKKNKWRTETLRRHIGYAQNRIEWFEKIRAALDAGYSIVPDMNIELFAIRTSAKKPRPNEIVSPSRYGYLPKDQSSNCPPLGEGEYVSPDAKYLEEHFEKPPEREGEKPTPVVKRYATEHGEIEFPFQLVKTEVLELTAESMQKKIFDEIGILPRRPSADPMVIGRITLKGNNKPWNRKSVNFVVAWFLDLKDFE